MPERSVSTVNDADGVNMQVCFPEASFLPWQGATKILCKPRLNYKYQMTRPLCREVQVQQHPVTTPVLINTALVRLNYMKLLIWGHF